MDAKQAALQGLVTCEDADGNIEYLTELAYDIRSRRAEPTAFPIGHNKRTAKPVTAHTPGEVPDVEDPEEDHPTLDTAASIVERLKATTTEAEARAVVGDDQRKTVLKMLDMHLKKLAKQ